jgi:diguanylate cyclase (GGDEF)-like protein
MSGPDAVSELRLLSAAVLEATAVEDVVDAYLAAARSLVGVDQVHLVEVSQDAAVGHARVVAYEAGGRREDAYVMVLDERPSGVTAVVRTGEPLVVPEARGSNALRADYTERFGVRSVVFAPIAWSGEVRWAAVLARTRPEPFGDDDVELILLLANQAAAGLALLESREASTSRVDKDEALTRAAAALNASLDLDTVLRTLTQEAALALGSDMAGVYLGDGTTGGVATAGHNTPPEWSGYLMKPGEGVGGQVLKTGRAAITNAYQEDVRRPATSIAENLQTAVAVPMSWDGALKGALSLGFSRMRRVTPGDLRLLEAFADLSSVACRNAEAFQSAARLDALTGALEHGSLEAALAERGEDVTCLVVALDGFDAVNERQGHRRGDDVLRRVAGLLGRVCGEEAAIGRFGGDQFAVAVTGDPGDLADQVLGALASELDLSASIGVARGGADVLDRALRAAREAKVGGGGRVSYSR